MKIFFCASIRGKKEKLYQRIVEILRDKGHKVFADHIMKTDQKMMDAWTSIKREVYYKKVLNNLRDSDIVVAEISYPSLSMGYLVALSVNLQKPTIVLFYGNEKSNILSPLESLGQLHVIEYNDIKEIERLLRYEVDLAAKEVDTRFTLLLPPDIVSSLDKVAKSGKSRSEYIRNLIRKDMKRRKK